MVSAASLARWTPRWRSSSPTHLHCRQCLLIGRQLGQASAPGLRGTGEEIWSEGKAELRERRKNWDREKAEKTAKEVLERKFSTLCFFNGHNISQLNLVAELI